MASNERMENLGRMLGCPLCLEQYKEPRILPCLHSYCEKCLERHMVENEKDCKFPCPLCTIEFPVPKQGVTGFRKNTFLYQFDELFPESEGEGSKCDFHCKTNLTKNHRVVSLDEVKSGLHAEEIRRHQKVYCPIHLDKFLELNCEQCQVPLCLLCFSLNHSQHKLKDLSEASKNASEVLRNLLEAWQDVTEHCELLCERRKEFLQSLSHQKTDCEAKIKQIYRVFLAEITREVEVHEKRSIDELNVQVQVARKQAGAACDEAEMNRLKFSSVLQYVNNILESAQDAEKLQHFNEIRSCLESLHVNEIDTQVKKTVFECQREKIAIPDLPLGVVTKLQTENISSKFSKRIASSVEFSNVSPVHHVTSQQAVKERGQLKRRFKSVLEEDCRVWSWCGGLAVGEGMLIVAYCDNNNAAVFTENDLTLKFKLNSTQHRLQSSLDVTCNRLGEILITDRGIHGVVKYDAAGLLMKVYPGVYQGDGYITCHTDQLIVEDTDGGRVLYTDFDCKVHHQIDAHSLGLSKFSPGYICLDENTGHVVVSQLTPLRVYVIDPTQPAVIHTLSDGLGGPWGVCVDQFGHILLADCNLLKSRIILLTPARAHVMATEDDVFSLTAICTSGPGQVYVLEGDGDVKEFIYLDV